MKIIELKLITIVCEAVLTKKIIETIKELGAKGFTATDVRGEGSSERNASDSPDDRIKIEVLVNENLAKQIMKNISENYFKDYSLIMYSTDAQGIRESKF
jgi:nitrogen regulatory protein PII